MELEMILLVIFAIVLITGMFGVQLFVKGWRNDKGLKLIAGFLLLGMCLTLLFGTIWVLNNVMLYKVGG